MAEFRWILLGLGVLLLAGIWWWGMRRSRQSPGNSQLRETRTPTASIAPVTADRVDVVESRDWGVPPFEPLSIRTAEFEEVQLADIPMTATAEPLEITEFDAVAANAVAANAVAAREHAPESAHAPVADERSESPSGLPPSSAEPTQTESPADTSAAPEAAATEAAPEAAATEPPAAAGETQRIVTIRVCAVGDSPWPGEHLLSALETHGLVFGRYKVFHRKHHDGRTLFCAASLVEPGTFDIANMPHEVFRGLTLFAVLPGPADAVHTVETLIATAAELAASLQGAVQDAKGAPLSAQKAEALRADVARFQLAQKID